MSSNCTGNCGSCSYKHKQGGINIDGISYGEKYKDIESIDSLCMVELSSDDRKKIMDSRRSSVEFGDKFIQMYENVIGKRDEGDLAVINVTWVTTESCNLACTYCYECRKKNRHMTNEVAIKSVQTLFDTSKMDKYFKDKEAIIIEFIGGEPFINIEVMHTVVEEFLRLANELNHRWRHNYMISVTTNGTLMFKPRVQEFIQRYKDRLSVGITIDGNKKLHDECRLYHNGKGSYDDVIKGVDYAMKEFGMKGTKVTFAPENIGFINEAIPHLFNIGLTDISANCAYEDIWDNSRDPKILYDQLIQLADWMIDNKIYKDCYVSILDNGIGQPMPLSENSNWCGGTGSMLAISVDGKFAPCIRYLDYALGATSTKEIIVGDIENGIYDYVEELEDMKKITRSSQSTDECMTCPVAGGCSWCSAYHLDAYGDINKRATNICFMHKARVMANDYYWNSVYMIENINAKFKMNVSDEDVDYILQGGKLKLPRTK